VLGDDVRLIFEARKAYVEITAFERGGYRCPRYLNESRAAAESPGHEFSDLDIESANSGGIGRIRFDERSAPFGVRTPAQHTRRRVGI
jgi:hypothetical protein